MRYYESTELAELYGVSRRTITNWIEQTQQGRLDLELVKEGENYYIASTPKTSSRYKALLLAVENT